MSELSTSWTERNREHVRAWSRRYYAEHSEFRKKAKIRYNKWYAINKQILLYARKMGIGVPEARKLLRSMDAK